MSTVRVVGNSIHAELVWQRAAQAGVSLVTVDAADVLWIAHEIDEHDRLNDIEYSEAFSDHDGEVIVQSPVPLGTCERLERYCKPRRPVTYFLENVRQGDTLADFPRPPVVRGRSKYPTPHTDAVLGAMFGTDMIEMPNAAAELVKHGINGLLATLAAYSEEIRKIGHRRGMTDDALERVARAIRSDPRFGPKLPILPKGRYSAHLNRDVWGLFRETERNVTLPLLEAVLLYGEDR